MRFRPCIDLHQGQVKQIVGGSLSDASPDDVVTNFVAREGPGHFARMYRQDGLAGGHVIMLGPGNEAAAAEALRAWPGGLQVGGGIAPANAASWLAQGAHKIIVTSYVFREGRVDWERLAELATVVPAERLVLDLSCRRRAGVPLIVTDRWQRFTDVELTAASMTQLAGYCSEFLVHAVDVEGRQQGIDEDLVRMLAGGSPLPVTYAGGIRSLQDLERIEDLGRGRVDATAGSALDIFGGSGLNYSDVVVFDKARRGTGA